MWGKGVVVEEEETVGILVVSMVVTHPLECHKLGRKVSEDTKS